MPVYEEIYRPWSGRLVPKPKTWWIIARTGIQLRWKRAMMLLILLASVPFAIRAGQIYVATRLADRPQLAEFIEELQIDAGFFAEFLRGQAFFVMIVIILAGAGLIADDRRFRALSIYFSKPVRFWEYALGKFLIIGFYGGLVTLVPGLLLFSMRVLLSQDASFLGDYYWVIFSMLGQVCLSLLVLGGIMLALSAAAGRARSAAILFFAVLLVPDLFRQILPGISGLGYFSLQALIGQVTALLFGQDLPYDFSGWLGLAVLLCIAGLSLLLLRMKVRPTEVVR